MTIQQSQSADRGYAADISAGCLVFLITLPLCLGIALASGFPAVAGVTTSVIGGLLTGFLGGAPRTIKGAPAGLIVVVLGAVQELSLAGDPASGYQRTLAVLVAAGILQVLFGLVGAGKLSDLFPSSVVHGMLAAIGVIIMAKQIHVMLGVAPTAKVPLGLIGEVPGCLLSLNPEVALIGLMSIVTMTLCAKPNIKKMIKIPAALLVLVIGIGLSTVFDFKDQHSYVLMGHTYEVSSKYLVTLPASLVSDITFPDWSALGSFLGFKHLVIIALIASLESSLTVKAMDSVIGGGLRTNVNKDLVVRPQSFFTLAELFQTNHASGASKTTN